MKYLCLVLYFVTLHECTVDLNIQDLVYIADHLSAAECRRLFASLLFTSNKLPENLTEAEEKVPKDVPCVKLLIKWNSGDQPWEGKGKSHTVVGKRLRQLGHADLSDWLGKLVFHKLARSVNNSLNFEKYFEEDKKLPQFTEKIYKDKDSLATAKWTTIDTIFSVTLFGLLFVSVAALFRILSAICRKAKIKLITAKDKEEMVDLLSIAESVESDQETVYEYEHGKRSHVSFKLELDRPEDDSDK
nr:uncharacterized protein LOC110376259 [Helicoverpa armigera]